MKKLLIALAFAGVSLGASAQDSDPVLKYSVATNSFWSNWFVQVGGDFNSWISDQEHGRGLDQILGHVGIVCQQLLGILRQTVAAISERRIIVEGADARVQSHTRYDGLAHEDNLLVG